MKIYDIKSNLLDLARCHTCGIREGALCSEMADDEFRRLSLSVEDFQYPVGSVLFRQESEGLHIFSIRKGMVKLTRLRPNGDQRIMRILRPGDVGGLEVIVTEKYEYDAIALDDVLACRIPVDVIQQMDAESPQLHKKLLEKWHTTLHEADEWMVELTAGTVRARLARLRAFDTFFA
jgi:CRP/FNR family transcriptional regulator